MNAGMHEFLGQDRVVWGKPVARGAMENMWAKTNPRPLRELADVVRLLEAAW